LDETNPEDLGISIEEEVEALAFEVRRREREALLRNADILAIIETLGEDNG